MTKARDIADFKFEDIVDTGTEGTKVASGTTAQRGSTTGQFRFNSTTGLAEYYDGSQFKAIDAPPTVTSISPTTSITANENITITGSNFSTNATVSFVGSDGTEFQSPSVTRNSSTEIVAQTPSSVLTVAKEPYDIKVTNSSGLSNTLLDALDAGSSPAFTVASGTLGSLNDGNRAGSNLTTIGTTDADGQSVTISLKSGSSLPTGLTLNSNGTFSGTADAVVSNTTTTFTVEATDGVNINEREYSITVKAPITAEYLVIAGGGAGSGDRGGGGGAGGYRNSYASETSGGNSSSESALTLTGGTTYTITVGSGGSGTSGAGLGTAGSNSVFSTITSTGGGQGGFGSSQGGNGYSGGSGGGARNNTGATGGSGTSNQGTSGGNNPTNDGNPGGGGGGAGQSGTNGGTSGGNGGNGLSSEITGSAVTRAGGGGSGGDSSKGINGSGGTGGGGDGGLSANGTNATVNTGSGGGGGGNGNTSSGNGGSGIVIIRLATDNYTGTTTGSPTVTNSGQDTILTFTGSGSYTA